MEGKIDDIIEALQRADFEEKLAVLTGVELAGFSQRRGNTEDDE